MLLANSATGQGSVLGDQFSTARSERFARSQILRQENVEARSFAQEVRYSLLKFGSVRADESSICGLLWQENRSVARLVKDHKAFVAVWLHGGIQCGAAA